jgi:small subunit ribosomal protein S17e
MGRIKSLPIKRTTLELLEKRPELFSDNFEHNKKVVNKVVEADKKTRNSIAGYVSRIVKRTNKKSKKI